VLGREQCVPGALDGKREPRGGLGRCGCLLDNFFYVGVHSYFVYCGLFVDCGRDSRQPGACGSEQQTQRRVVACKQSAGEDRGLHAAP
jgi:hypothetical protein